MHPNSGTGSSELEERLNRITSSLGTTKGATENMRSTATRKDLENLDTSVMTDMKLCGSDSDSSDLDLDDTEKKGLLSENSCDMEFESVKSGIGYNLQDDREMQVEMTGSTDDGSAGGGPTKRKKNKALLKSQKQIEKQNELIIDAMKISLDTHKLSQQANLELRSQREQIINIVNMVREIGIDLFRADKLAKDINYRRLLNIIMLYIIQFFLFLSILFTLFYKVRHRWFPNLFHHPGSPAPHQ